jgi:hypothetical protein
VPPSARARVAAAVLVAAAASTVAALATTGDAPALRTAVVMVYNAERPCQRSTRPTCRLGLARDPYAVYAADNVSARVRHGDRLVVECYVPDGTVVAAENGWRSKRWYRVRLPAARAWLPAVRVWPETDPHVVRCES